MLDGMNVDVLCKVAFEVFERGRSINTGAPPVFNLRGEFKLSDLLSHGQTATGRAVERVSYSRWYQAAQSWCSNDSSHPLTALMPHIDSDSPPLASAGSHISAACKAAVGPELTAALLHCSGMEAFSVALAGGPWSMVL